MDRRKSESQWCRLLLCAWIALAVSGYAKPSIAVPHTTAPVDHPFDPDWPDVYMILANKCSGCHRRENDRTDFNSYESLMDAGRKDDMPVVVPGKPDDSPLYNKVLWNARARAELTSLPDSPEMPPEKHEWLTANQQEIIRRWIERGALEYLLPDQCNTRPLMEMDFPSAKQCAACHPKQYDEWSRSMHAYAQHSPVFEAFNLTLQERTSGTMGTFCTRCHTPQGVALGENGQRRNVHRARISMEGVSCISCHRRPGGHYKSSGRVAITPGKLLDSCIYGPFEDAASDELNSHASKGKPYIQQSQFCGECHDVTSPIGLRLEEAFSEWHNSPAAAAGIRCHDCHMGPVQGLPIPVDQRPLGRAATVPGVDKSKIPLRHLSDHTFAGPDYSLLPDTEFPHKLDWMYEVDYRDIRKLTPYQQRTLTELRRQNRASLKIAEAKRYELLTNAANIHVEHPACATAGRKIRVHVAVQNKVAGHNFPTGFTAERQLWVSVVLRDPSGRVVHASGDLDKNGDLRDDHSHEVLAGKLAMDKHLLNFQSKFISLNSKGTERSVILAVNRHLTPVNILRPADGIAASFGRPGVFRIAKGSLPPLKTLDQTYPITFPDTPGPYTLNVQLNFRHLPPTLLDHVGTPHLKHLLEVVVIDRYQTTINVMP